MTIEELPFLSNTLAGNPVGRWLAAAGLVAALFLVLKVGIRLLVSRLARVARSSVALWDDVVVEALGATRGWFLITLAVAVVLRGTPLVSLGDAAHRTIRILVILIGLAQIGAWALHGINAAGRLRAFSASPSATALIQLLARTVLLATLLVSALDTLGVNITALVAGLGVGGIAIALATQNILGDLFASLSILIDKPFEVGDTIVVGDFTGTIERIGLKTTRLRSVGGEQVVFSNSDLLQSRIRNLQRAPERRIVLTVGVTYATSVEDLERLPSLIRRAVESCGSAARFEGALLKTLGDWAIQYEVIFWANPPSELLRLQHAAQIAIVRVLREAGVELAFPTQTLHLERPRTAEVVP